MTDRWWDTNRVAEYLGVAPRTVSAYLSRGQMPAPDGRGGPQSGPLWRPATITG